MFIKLFIRVSCMFKTCFMKVGSADSAGSADKAGGANYVGRTSS
jgi:hypothetical protein